MKLLSTCLIGLCGVYILYAISGDVKRQKTFEELSKECDQKMLLVSKEIQLDLMYHCNNNTCVNYGLGFYKLECMYNSPRYK